MASQTEKEIILHTMYRSVERMNLHVLKGNTDGVHAERALQINLRTNFEEVSGEDDA